jgi:hypothetical protein
MRKNFPENRNAETKKNKEKRRMQREGAGLSAHQKERCKSERLQVEERREDGHGK